MIFYIVFLFFIYLTIYQVLVKNIIWQTIWDWLFVKYMFIYIILHLKFNNCSAYIIYIKIDN